MSKNTEINDSRAEELVILWDADLVDKDDYAAMVSAVGDLVRASGGVGLERRNGTAPKLPRSGAEP